MYSTGVMVGRRDTEIPSTVCLLQLLDADDGVRREVCFRLGGLFDEQVHGSGHVDLCLCCKVSRSFWGQVVMKDWFDRSAWVVQFLRILSQ